MKAAFIERYGAPEVIQYGDLPIPAVGPGDVLVRVEAVTVNSIDAFIRAGTYPIPAPMPFVIGRDLVGTVVETGSSVTRFHNGDRVWANNQGYGGRQGSFGEYCSVAEDLLYPLPAGVDPYETAAVVHSALTAVLGLQFKAKLQAGETVFVNGGDGNVGTAVLTIAKALGARVAVTSGRDEKAEWCRQLGADVVINYKTEDVAGALRKFAPEGVNVYFDTTRQSDLRVGVLAGRGRILLIAGMSHETTLPVWDFYLRNATLFGYTVTDATVEELARYAVEINRWLGHGVVRARIARTMPLSEAAEAHRLFEAGGLFGKIVLVPGEGRNAG